MTRSSWQKKRAKKWSTMLCSIRCKTKDSLVHVTHKIIFFPEILLRWRIMRFVERQRLPSNLSKMLHKFLNKVVWWPNSYIYIWCSIAHHIEFVWSILNTSNELAASLGRVDFCWNVLLPYMPPEVGYESVKHLLCLLIEDSSIFFSP